MLAVLRQRNFALLWTASLVSVIGDFALIIALPLQVYLLTHSAFATAAIFIASYVPNALLGSVAGVFVDRWNRRTTMVWTNLARVIVLIPLILVRTSDQMWLLYLVAALETIISVFFIPAENALLPHVVSDEQLVTANSLNALSNNIARLIGPALGGILFTVGGFSGVVVFDSVTYLVAGVLVAFIGIAGTSSSFVAREGSTSSAIIRVWSDWLAGIRLVASDSLLIALFAVGAAVFLCEGAFSALGLAPFVLKVLGGNEAYAGLLPSTQAIGGLIGGIIVARYGQRVHAGRLFGYSAIALGLCDLALFNSRALPISGMSALVPPLIFMFLAGFPAVASMVAYQTLAQSSVEDTYRGRLFGALGAVQALFFLTGVAIGGALGDSIGIVQVLSAAAVLYAMAGVAGLIFLRARNLQPINESAASAPVEA